MKLFKSKAKLSVVCAVLSFFTVAAFHIPFFRHAAANVEGGFNGVLIIASLALLMAAIDYFLYYLLLWLGRGVGRFLVAFTLIGDSICLYFINTYDVIIDDSMMGNVFNTQFSEASGFFSLAAVLYVLLLGILPSAYVFARKIDFGRFGRFGANIGVSLAIVLGVALGNMSNWPWIDRNSTVLGSLLMPWSFTVNSVRYQSQMRERGREEILLPDAHFKDDGKAVCVLVIGESARRDRFSLYGYTKPTNPLLEQQEGLVALKAEAAATYTTAGVKAIIDSQESDELYEVLPNYLFRAGADVSWRTSNWGEPPLHIEEYLKVEDLKKLYPEADAEFDGLLFEGLAERIQASDKSKVLIVIHTSTSHGPSYNKRYPPEFERFSPVCTTVEMSKADPVELNNSYDNSIVYTDFLINSAIEQLRSLPDEWKSLMIYVSDHGESLGEGNLYMHGVPMSIAPREQVEIPFIVWSSSRRVRDCGEVGQHHVFHSVMDFLGAESEIYKAEKSIFE